jgi:hypothetical protein
MRDNVENILKNNYDFVKNNLMYPEKIIDHYFGIDNLNYEISNINERIFEYTFIGLKHPEKYIIFEFSDFIDFINTYTYIDSTDLIIYIDEKEFNIFVLNFIKILNSAFKFWILSKGSGFRKNTKLLLTFKEGNSGIYLEYIPDLKIN